MNINELFEKIQDDFHPEELNGEFLLQGNAVVWSYILANDTEEIEYSDDEDDENFFNFEAQSDEELLQEAYQEDLEKLQDLLDEIDETDNWTISDFETSDEVISFKIY